MLVAPVEEDSARARIGQRLERGVAESLLDLGDLLDVVCARAPAQTEKVLTRLVALQKREQAALGRGHLGCDRSVVARNELGRAVLAAEAWPAAPAYQYFFVVPSASLATVQCSPLASPFSTSFRKLLATLRCTKAFWCLQCCPVSAFSTVRSVSRISTPVLSAPGFCRVARSWTTSFGKMLAAVWCIKAVWHLQCCSIAVFCCD